MINESDLMIAKNTIKQLIELAERYALLKFNESGNASITDVDESGISFDLRWETGCMGCYDQHLTSFELPFELLGDPGWEQTIIRELEEQRARQAAAEKAAAAKYQQELETREQAEYQRLQAKYGKAG